MEELKLNIMAEGGELIIRQGKAAEPLPTREDKPLTIKGDIYSVAAYLAARHTCANAGLQAVNTEKSVIRVDKQKRTITLETDPNNYYSTTVTGELVVSEEVERWGINKEKIYNREDLLKLVKMNRALFQDKDEHLKLLSGLKMIKLSTRQELSVGGNDRGSKNASYEQVVENENNMPKCFGLFCPVYRGGERKLIPVEICYETQGGALVFWLESMQLAEMMEEILENTFTDQLQKCEGYMIIHA